MNEDHGSSFVEGLWVPYDPDHPKDSGYLKASIGEMDLDGVSYQVKADVYEVSEEEAKGTPTEQRADLVVTRDSTTAPDRTVIIVPGYGESPLLMMPLVRAFAQHLHREGAQNPAFLIPTTGGRGTESYVASNKGSVTHLSTAIGDAARLPVKWNSEGLLGGAVSVVGHSMGDMLAWRALEALLELQKGGETGFSLKQHTGLMPATSARLGGLRPSFIWGLRDLVVPAVIRYFTGEGLDLRPDQYRRLMLGEDLGESTAANFAGTVPDSARVFLDWTLFNFEGQRFPNPESIQDNKGFKTAVFWAGQEGLLPANMGKNQVQALANAGLHTSYEVLEYFAHSFPVKMTPQQEAELAEKAERMI